MSCAPRSRIDGFVRPSRLRRGRRAFALPLLVLAGAGASLTLIAIVQRMPPAVEGAPPWIDRAAVAAGLTIAQIDVRGHSYTQRFDVLAALDIPPALSQRAFDPDAARRRIEALPWVHRAKVERILPDRVGVEITERKPAILWRGPDRDALVDMDGRELSTVPRGSSVGLPVVTGAGAGPAAPGLVTLVRAHPQIERRMAEARRIEDRRWTLLLASGTLVHLPGDGGAAALAWIEAHADSGLLDRGLAAIDLRVPGQLVVREGATRLVETQPSEPAARSRQTARAQAAGGVP